MLSCVNAKRRKGAYQLSRKEGSILILQEEVSDDISFFVFRKELPDDPFLSC
jgi:hypothetical protein